MIQDLVWTVEICCALRMAGVVTPKQNLRNIGWESSIAGCFYWSFSQVLMYQQYLSNLLHLPPPLSRGGYRGDVEVFFFSFLTFPKALGTVQVGLERNWMHMLRRNKMLLQGLLFAYWHQNLGAKAMGYSKPWRAWEVLQCLAQVLAACWHKSNDWMVDPPT